MKKKSRCRTGAGIVLSFVLTFSGFAAAPAAAAAPPAPAAPLIQPASSKLSCTGTTVAEVRKIILDATNAQRKKAGKSALKVDAAMNTVAANWSSQMAKNKKLSHNPKYSSQIPKGSSRSGENVAAGYKVREVTPAWIASAGHRANIEQTGYTHIGIGVACRDGYPYYTQVFGSYKSAPAAASSVKVGSTYKTKSSLNLRSGAGTNHKVLANLKAGTSVGKILKKSGAWAQVKVGGRTGWVHTDYLTGGGSAQASATKSTTKAAASSSAVTYTTKSSVNLRSGAGTNHKILTTLKPGTKVGKALKKSGVWIQVKVGNRTGWLHSGYVKSNGAVKSATTTTKKSSSATYTTKSSVNLRSGAGTNHKILTTLKPGTKVGKALKKSGVWIQVKVGNRTGWVHSGYLR